MCRKITALKSSGERGAGRMSVLLFILVAVAGVYIGSQVIPFFYYYNELQGLMDSQAAKAQVLTDEEMRTNIMKKVKELSIPFDDPDKLKINRFNGNIVIELEYQEILYLDLGPDRTYDLYIFNFHPRAEHRI